MGSHWQLISDNGGVFKRKTVELSTVAMPHIVVPDLGYAYESCMFTGNGESEVLQRYNTLSEAVEGHTRWCARLGLSL